MEKWGAFEALQKVGVTTNFVNWKIVLIAHFHGLKFPVSASWLAPVSFVNAISRVFGQFRNSKVVYSGMSGVTSGGGCFRRWNMNLCMASERISRGFGTRWLPFYRTLPLCVLKNR